MIAPEMRSHSMRSREYLFERKQVDGCNGDHANVETFARASRHHASPHRYPMPMT
jgi:hypothetical protein